MPLRNMKQYDGKKVRVTYNTADQVDEGFARYCPSTNTLEVYDNELCAGSWKVSMSHYQDGLLADILLDEIMVRNIEVLN